MSITTLGLALGCSGTGTGRLDVLAVTVSCVYSVGVCEDTCTQDSTSEGRHVATTSPDSATANCTSDSFCH